MDNGYVGWSGTQSINYEYLFSNEMLSFLQSKITELLQGVDDANRPIIVPIENIRSVLYQCYDSFVPNAGDIYSRYIIDKDQPRNDIRDIVDRAVNIIVTQIRNEIETIRNNRRLSIWSTLYGDFNKQGLRQHSVIKVRKRGPERFQFNMRY